MGLSVPREMAGGALTGAVGAMASLSGLGATGGLSSGLVTGDILWCLLVVLGIHDDIERLLRGTEPKLGT